MHSLGPTLINVALRSDGRILDADYQPYDWVTHALQTGFSHLSGTLESNGEGYSFDKDHVSIGFGGRIQMTDDQNIFFLTDFEQPIPDNTSADGKTRSLQVRGVMLANYIPPRGGLPKSPQSSAPGISQ